jgi:outer membrane receptor for Fe3+-dicitrate
MVATALLALLLAAVLAALMFSARSHFKANSYAELEIASRRGLEQFAQDTRQASAITWNSSREVVLVVDTQSITYGFDSTNRVFYREVGLRRRALITGVTDFSLTGYAITGVALPLATTANLADANQMTKQLQISLNASRQSRMVSSSTNTVISGKYILRNKRVTS